MQVIQNTLEHKGYGSQPEALFEIKRNAVNRFYFVFRISSKEQILVSKSFADRSGLEAGISQARVFAQIAQVEDKKPSAPGIPFFKASRTKKNRYVFELLGPDGELTARSNEYQSLEKCLDSIEIFRESAVEARIIDLS